MAGLTAREMEYEAKVVYEALASADAPGYTSRQWSILLTQAQEKVVKSIIQEGVDKNEKNRRIVAKLIKNATYDNEVIFVRTFRWANSFIIPIPEDYMYLLEDYVNKSIRVKPVSYDFVHANENNPFEKPNKSEYFWRVMYHNGVIIVTDGTPIDEYSLVYLTRPKPIITKDLSKATSIEGELLQRDCQLDPIVHRDIVEYAGKLAKLYANDSQGYQLSMMEEHTIK